MSRLASYHGKSSRGTPVLLWADTELTAAGPAWVSMPVRIVCRHCCNTLTMSLSCGLRRDERREQTMLLAAERKILKVRLTTSMLQVQAATSVLGVCCSSFTENWTRREPWSLVEHGNAARRHHCGTRLLYASCVIRTVQARVAGNETLAVQV